MKNCLSWISIAVVLLLTGLPASAITPESITRGLSKVFNIDDVDDPPVPVKRSPPFYSPELRAAKVHGGVVVEFVTGLKGEVVGAQAVSSDDNRLNDAAVAAVKTWQYKPAKYKGHEVFCRSSVVVEFNLN
jgi:protein TonB